jgi:hypothetical protein
VLICRANFAMMRGLVDALAADCCADACAPAPTIIAKT